MLDDKIQITVNPILNFKDKFYLEACCPWNSEKPNLVSNFKAHVLRQTKTNSEQYLTSKGITIKDISEKIYDHLDKGYITEITPIVNTNDPDQFYIPYFPVFKADRLTTKVRIVFDAACKDKNGTSLNSQIADTPNRLNDLIFILLNFRKFKYAIMADISEMFLRIRLHSNDRKYHRFWFDNKIFEWNRILFGNKASPNISQKSIQLIAELEKENNKLAYDCINNFMYMDDATISLENENNCLKLANELIYVLGKYDFNITKFYSNSKLVTNSLSKDILAKQIDFKENDVIFESTKVLGMVWSAESDSFSFKCKFNSLEEFYFAQKIKKIDNWTHRLILRFSATCYDPMGFISPFTVRARSILQKCSNLKLKWDDFIPENLNKDWQLWLNDLFSIDKYIKIDRHLFFDKLTNGINDVQLHIFTDASTEIIAACAYVRIPNKDTSARGEGDGVCKNFRTNLVLAKAKVAPKNVESVSRLELAACVIGARLANTVKLAYNILDENIYYWTDSKNCLYWINTPACSVKTFVANRVGEIQNRTEISSWRHIPGELNPADIATRPPSLDKLSKNKVWWNGPTFLETNSNWPEKVDYKTGADRTEFKKEFLQNESLLNVCNSCNIVSKCDITSGKPKVTFGNQVPKGTGVIDLFAPCCNQVDNSVFKTFEISSHFIPSTEFILSFSKTKIGPINPLRVFNWQNLLRNVSLIISLANKDKTLSQKEITNRAVTFLLRRAQCDNGSTIKQPHFRDQHGLIRLKSRISEIDYLDYNVKFPVIFDSNNDSRYLTLLLKYYHEKYEHPISKEACLNKINDLFYIDHLAWKLKNIRKNCYVCKKLKTIPISQQIASLPKYRFQEPLQAFSKIGIDFAGPISVKVGRGQARMKAYILVITCLQTRALNLEITSGMDFKHFINALNRHMNIRGMPNLVLSDNFATFLSDEKELQNWVRSTLTKDKLLEFLPAKVEWKTIPPYGSHHGGIYESQVKSTKRALKSLMSNESNLDMEELRTLATHVINLVNSRPLTQVKDKDIVLTPNHFLHGNMGGMMVDPDKLDTLNKRWTTVENLLDQFWKLFIKNYLIELRKSNIWLKDNPSLRVGDLCLELDPNVPRGLWKLALITEILPNSNIKDTKVRKVKIKTTKGEYVRSISKLCPLEINLS